MIPKKSPLSIVGIFRFLASHSSGLFCFTAAVYTTKSELCTFFKSWPIETKIPLSFNLSVISVLFKSEPVTVNPQLCKISAIPLILIPTNTNHMNMFVML